VRKVIGEALHSLGHLDEAEEHLRRALDIQLGLGGSIALSERYETTARLAEVYSETDSRDAFELKQRASHLAAEVIGEHHGPIEHQLDHLIHNVLNADIDVARSRFEDLRVRSATEFTEHDAHWLHLADVYDFLGHTLGYHWGSEEGIPYLEEALAIRRSELPVTHPKIAFTLNELVTILNQHGRHQHAEELVGESLTIYESALPEDHWLLAESRSLLGECLSGQGYFIAAEDLLLPAHAAIIGKLGTVSRAGIDSTYRLVRHYESTGRPNEANEMRDTLAQALAFSRNAPWSWGSRQAAVFREEHGELTRALERLDAMMMEGTRNFGEVDETYQWKLVTALEDVLSARHELLPDEDPRAVIVARLLSEYSQIGVAQTYVLDRLMGEEILRVTQPHQDRLTQPVASALRLLGSTAFHGNDPERAEEYFGQAWELLEEKWGVENQNTIRAQALLSRALVAQGRYEEAQSLLARSWEECMASLGPHHESTLDVLRNLRDFYGAWGRPTMFETYLEKHLQLPIDEETDARRVHGLAHDAVRSPGFSPKLYEHALRAARRAVELNPTNEVYASTVGKALFRLGRYDEARVQLEHASGLSGGMYIDDWPFLAMVYAILGDDGAATDALAQLDHVLQVKRPDADARRFIAEAEALTRTTE
jgi:tetratricopeptide (TPR) repeat protein